MGTWYRNMMREEDVRVLLSQNGMCGERRSVHVPKFSGT